MTHTKRRAPELYLAEAVLLVLEQLDALHAARVGAAQDEGAALDAFNEWTRARDDYRPLLEDIVRRFK